MLKALGVPLLVAGIWLGAVCLNLSAENPPAELPEGDSAPAVLPAAKSPKAKTSSAPAETAGEAPQPDTAEDEPAADAGKKYDLKYKFTAGEVMRSEVTHRAVVQTTIDGSTQKAETQSKSIKCWQIKDVADGTVTFVHLVESIEMWQRMQGREEIRYDSRTDKEVPPGYEDAAKAVGVPLTIVTMDMRGKILKRQEKRAQPTSVSTQMTMPLPDGPIAIGQTWSSPVDIDVVLKDGSNKKIRTRQQFTLEKVVAELATITIDSQVLTPVNDPAIEAQLIQRMSNGTVKFDINAGRVLSQQLDLDRHVIGFSGAASSMHYVTRFTEEALSSTVATASKPPAKTAAKGLSKSGAPPAAKNPGKPRNAKAKDADAPRR